jgi:surface carbohydrate biosynthesis protein (TIGR04326 family)
VIDNDPCPRLTLWDSQDAPPDDGSPVYGWNGHAETGSVHSLLRYAEQHGERLRRKYLAWVHDVGAYKVDGTRLIDHLALEDGLSYWWMTLLVEQSPWKSPAIVDAIRVLAFEEIVLDRRPAVVTLVSRNRALHEVVRGLCRGLGIAYEWKRAPGRPWRRMNAGQAYRAWPYAVRALIGLARQLWMQRPFTRLGRPSWSGGERSVFFCSYFDNIDSTSAGQGRFLSYYWDGLPDLMRRAGRCTNWLQIFVPDPVVPDGDAASRLARGFNRTTHEQETHGFVESYLGWRGVRRVLVRWLRLIVFSWRLRAVRRAFCPQGSRLSLWPIMRGDWLNSMRGPAALRSLVWIELFDAALSELPRQKTGVYLQENQAWERALIHAWRKHGHGRLMGVAHSTVRFWDLRYFADPRTARSSEPHALPRPDVTILNGEAARHSYSAVDRPDEVTVACEALRYGYLDRARAERQRAPRPAGAPRIVALGDMLEASTVRLLRMLQAAAPLMPVETTFAIRSHPNHAVSARDYPDLNLEVVTEQLEQALQDGDVACACNTTSAAVDAYLAGVPVVVVLDDTTLNFSPLRDWPDVRFVSAFEELAEALQTAQWGPTPTPDAHAFFCLDSGLPRWSRLLAT